MDDFKRKGVNEYTAQDLNVNCVCINAKNKKEWKKCITKLSRARLKNELMNNKKIR